MSHSWIELRLARAVVQTSPHLKNLRKEVRGWKNYSRHVMFFSTPQAVAHAEALILHASGREVQQATHGAHATTRERIDNQISQVVNDRAALTDISTRRPR